MSDVQELIERLEKDGPSRELDAAIQVAVGRARGTYAGRPHKVVVSDGIWEDPEPYTTSIDAALTLARDSNERAVLLQLVAGDLVERGLDPAEHGARLYAACALRARAAS